MADITIETGKPADPGQLVSEIRAAAGAPDVDAPSGPFEDLVPPCGP